jgi:hypothetical protein
VSALPLQDYGKFDAANNAESTIFSVSNQLRKKARFGLSKEDGNQRGSVYDHFGKPYSS